MTIFGVSNMKRLSPHFIHTIGFSHFISILFLHCKIKRINYLIISSIKVRLVKLIFLTKPFQIYPTCSWLSQTCCKFEGNTSEKLFKFVCMRCFEKSSFKIKYFGCFGHVQAGLNTISLIRKTFHSFGKGLYTKNIKAIHQVLFVTLLFEEFCNSAIWVCLTISKMVVPTWRKPYLSKCHVWLFAKKTATTI